MRVALASENQQKIEAVRIGFGRLRSVWAMADVDDLHIVAKSVPSKVSNQPLSLEQCRAGAENRVNALNKDIASSGASFLVGIEAGLIFVEGMWFDQAVVYVVDLWNGGAGGTTIGYGLSSGVPVSSEVMNLVREGRELSDAIDEYCGVENSKQREAWQSMVSLGLITRAEAYSHGVIFALGSLRMPNFGTIQDIPIYM